MRGPVDHHHARRPSAAVRPALAAGLLVAVCAVVGAVLMARGVPVHAPAAPLFAHLDPVAGARSLPALTVGALLLASAPRAATSWRWPALLTGSAVAAAAWTVSVALVRGPAGLLAPLAAPPEYLADVPRIRGSAGWLATFAAGIPAASPAPWRTHVAGHPPGMVGVFVLLDRLGLPGPGPAAALCVLAWAVAVPAVLVTAAQVQDRAAARRAAPFVVLLPAVVWAGVSADALLAGLGALGLAALALALGPGRGRPRWLWTVVAAPAAGLLLGASLFLSYGATLLAVPAAALVLLRLVRTGAVRPGRGREDRTVALVVGLAALGVLAVVGAFALHGFGWWEGFALVRGRYYAGWGRDRPFWYWVWADLAALALAVGPAVVTALAPAGRQATGSPGTLVLARSALLAVGLAALSGMSKGEVERIWLPWAVWMPLACARLPRVVAGRWLAGQVVLTLLLEHLFRTPW